MLRFRARAGQPSARRAVFVGAGAFEGDKGFVRAGALVGARALSLAGVLSLAGALTLIRGGRPALAQTAAAPPTPAVEATANPMPATTSCANPALPLAILAGYPAKVAAPPLRAFAVSAARTSLQLAFAGDPRSRELGLMCVTHMRPNAGMLFAFTSDATWEFWMKRTLIPLDMIWVAADGTVRSVQANVPAATLTTPDEKVARRSGSGRYVIELNAGAAKKTGIAPGVKFNFPALPDAT
jgi:uncharacterized membrane protein (UPF0127 family)